MREHEVPTHLQAEDRVLLWFTFQQLVAITAVAALSYGAYRYAPVGSIRGADSPGRPPGAGGSGHGRRKGGRPAAAPGGCRPPAVPAGPPALCRTSGRPRAPRAPGAVQGRIQAPSPCWPRTPGASCAAATGGCHSVPTAGLARAAGAGGRARNQNRIGRRPGEARTGGTCWPSWPSPQRRRPGRWPPQPWQRTITPTGWGSRSRSRSPAEGSTSRDCRCSGTPPR